MVGAPGGTQYPVVWPAGTTADANGGLSLPDAQRVALGDEVLGGGGYLELSARYHIPTECLPPSGEVAVFNANGKVSVNDS